MSCAIPEMWQSRSTITTLRRASIPMATPSNALYRPSSPVSSTAVGARGADHVMSWLCTRQDRPEFLLLRYEDMKREPMAELSRIASFLDRCSFRQIDSSPQSLERTIQMSSPERMRSLERQQGRRWLRLRKEREIKGYVAVRTAVSGGWKSFLPQESVAQIESAWGNIMARLSYSLRSDGADPSNLVSGSRKMFHPVSPQFHPQQSRNFESV